MKLNIHKKISPAVFAILLSIFMLSLLSASPSAAPADSLPESLPTLPSGEYGLTVDNKTVPLTSPIVFNAVHIPYLSIHDILTVLDCEAQYLGQGLLAVQKNGQPDSSVTLEYRWYGYPEQMTAKNWGEKYLPLSAVANEFGYWVDAVAGETLVKVYSPQYQASYPDDPAFAISPSSLPVYGTEKDAPYFADLWPGEEFLAIFYSSILDDLPGRMNNVALACNAMEGSVIWPGALFSYNQTVGPRTSARGFQIGRVYMGQTIVPGIGGGICQVSSTLYNAVLNSGLQVVERHPHSIKVEYVDPLKDATVSWGQLDFRFRNSLDFPITLHSRLVDNQYIVIAFSRTKV